ncbi:MAG: response regulator [Candidatus Diapherotrites archaeon]|nr:response regulator [Candidatus Diapherotrites archaeon]
MKVMIVEDEPDVAKAIKGVLVDEGFGVEIALGGKDCLEKLKKSEPDVILLDILMPIMDGTEVLRRLKKDKKTAKIPVIVLTAVSAESEVKKTLEEIDPKIGFIEKPYSIDQILAEIKKLVK